MRSGSSSTSAGTSCANAGPAGNSGTIPTGRRCGARRRWRGTSSRGGPPQPDLLTLIDAAVEPALRVGLPAAVDLEAAARLIVPPALLRGGAGAIAEEGRISRTVRGARLPGGRRGHGQDENGSELQAFFQRGFRHKGSPWYPVSAQRAESHRRPPDARCPRGARLLLFKGVGGCGS